MCMEGYIYLGEFYDILGREVRIKDKKIGYSKIPLHREYQLSRTKSPIGYRIVTAYRVNDMKKVENMLHGILDSRRSSGEWFFDDNNTLINEFINFMNSYGGERYEIEEKNKKDIRLVKIMDNTNEPLNLIRKYKGEDYDVLLHTDALLYFNGEKFSTPSKLYNNGIVKFVKGYKGASGSNSLEQFIIKENGKKLNELLINNKN